MASISTERTAAHAPDLGNETAVPAVLVCLPLLGHDTFAETMRNLGAAFPEQRVLIAAPELAQSQNEAPIAENLYLLREAANTSVARNGWVLTAGDFAYAFEVAEQHAAAACLLLGADSQSLSAESLRALAAPVLGGADLCVPRYHLGPREGLINSAILYPLCRAVFGSQAHFPLAVDLGLSLRMAERLAVSARRFTQSGLSDALLWPVSEAAVASYGVVEVEMSSRALPTPANLDLNTLLGTITGSLFADVDARAAFWQKTRLASRLPVGEGRPSIDGPPADTRPMQEAFRLAYKNLAEIWSLVLPPNSLLGLKRLSQMTPDHFRMSDALWARIVYDFLMAFRLRTINRGHLLGALTPLYLAWVASHLEIIASGVSPEHHIEQLAQAFELDKPYLVSRWRWPDRFNP